MSAEALKIREKGPAVWIAMAGFILCVVSSAGLIVMLIGPQSFRSLPAVAHLLAAAGLLPASAMRQAAPVSGAWNDAARIGARPWGQARYGVQGAAERDATERPRVPGWDPVVHLPAADLADLDPDQVVDRALGQVPDDDAFAPVPALTAGQSTPIRSAAGAPSADVAARRAVAATGSPAAEAAGSPRVAAEAAGARTAENVKSAAAEPAPAHQVLPPPHNVQPAAVFAIQMAFFLDAEAASGYAAALARGGIATRLVEQLDEAGRNWIYVRSLVFTDSVAALAYAETLERKFGVPALLVSEPPATSLPVPAASGK